MDAVGFSPGNCMWGISVVEKMTAYQLVIEILITNQ
jgi:hypothetical protein